jgi:hypothetical protein
MNLIVKFAKYNLETKLDGNSHKLIIKYRISTIKSQVGRYYEMLGFFDL